ncbi:MAG: SDR family oxidoreductase [Gammaproteobacteria bacterium]|nr:SDR family oxidoreductase [Gammaproteobacteria bacterium]
MTGVLDNKVAVITGGTSGIGLASAKRFAEEGARVVICGRSADNAAKIAASLGAGHVGIGCDVSDVGAIQRMADEVAAACGGIDILFANAGVAFYRPLAEWTEADFDRLFSINARGQFFTVQRFAPLMRSGGVVILTGSIAPLVGQPTMAVYAASKAVSPALAKNLSADLLPAGVRVLCLTPGPTATEIFARGGLSEAQAQSKLAEISERVPIGRAGTADELAAAALFLASDASTFMLGAELVVDGGKSQL